MKKRRTTRKAQKPPPAGSLPPSLRSSPAPGFTLEYKVVELSLVDEQSLERAVNTWVRQGYRLENVQFAMRESSRRPSMAFVFFTREVEAQAEPAEPPAREPYVAPVRSISAYERLAQLAEGGDDPERDP
jgi:hypothetical protein